MKQKWKRSLALLLTVAMAFSLLQFPAFAENAGVDVDETDSAPAVSDAAESAEQAGSEEPAETPAPQETEAKPANEDAADPGTQAAAAQSAEPADEKSSENTAGGTAEPDTEAPTVVSSGTCDDNLTWNLDSNGVLTISGTGDMNSHLWRDSYSKKITSVVLEEGITSINSQAFWGCTSLTDVTLPASLTNIGYEAFRGCTALTSITIPASVKSIASGVFSECNSLTHVTLPDTLESIESDAFKNSGLTSIAVPASVKSIANRTFSGCSSLTHVTLPDTLESIGSDAFKNSGLTSIAVPASVKSIASGAFSGCTALTEIRFEGEAPDCSGNIFDNVTATVHYPGAIVYGYNSVKNAWGGNLTWDPYDVDYAPSYASGTCRDNLTWNLDSNGVLTVSGRGDMYMNNHSPSQASYPWQDNYKEQITSVVVEEGVTSVGYEAFYDCTSLTDVTLPASLTTVGSQAFSGCTGLTSITIPASVKSIADGVFSGCTALTEIRFDGTAPECDGSAFDGVTAIAYYPGGDCFGWNDDVKNTLGGNLTWVAYEAIMASGTCGDNLTWILDGNGVLTVSGTGDMNSHPWRDSYKEQITSVILEEGVTSIEGGSFWGCSNLTDVTLPNTITILEGAVFDYCRKLKNVVLPNALIQIQEQPFLGCSSLTHVTLPDTLESIGPDAFQDSGLTSITIPASVKSIDRGVFSGCTALTEIRFEGAAPDCSGNIFDNVTATVHYPGAIVYGYNSVKNAWGGNLTWAPYDVDYAPSYASGTCGDNLTWNLDSNGVLTISGMGEVTSSPWQDRYREQITKVILDGGIGRISSGAFRNCTALTEAYFEGAPYTGYNSIFSGLTVTVYYSENFQKTWTDQAKERLGGTLTFQTYTPEYRPVMVEVAVDESQHWVLDNRGVLIVSGDAGDGYCYGTPLNDYRPAVLSAVIEEGVTRFAYESGLSDCVNMTSIDLPDSLQEMVSLSGCSSLERIEIPAKISSLGSFEGCKALKEVKLDAGVPAIYSAFDDTATATILYPDTFEDVVSDEMDRHTGGNLTWQSYHVEQSTLAEGTWGDNLAWTLDTAGLLTISGQGAMAELGNTRNYPWAAVYSHVVKKISVQPGVTSLAGSAFANSFDRNMIGAGTYLNLRQVELPDSLAEIGEHAFDQVMLKSITIPGSVRMIGEYAFSNCTMLKTVRFEGVAPQITTRNKPFDGVTAVVEVSKEYYANWTELEKSALGGNLTFRTYSPEDRIIASGTLDSGLDWALSSLGVLTVSGQGALDQKPWAEWGVLVLRVKLNEGVSAIGAAVFSDCRNMSNITVPSSVTAIGADAFKNCTALAGIVLPKAVAQVDLSAFEGCSSLRSFSVSRQNADYTSVGGVLFNKAQTELLRYPAVGTASYAVPDGVTRIDGYAFHNCVDLTDIEIASSVRTICAGAFEGCTGLTRLTFDGKAPQVGRSDTSQAAPFENLTALAEYPSSCRTSWTDAAKESMGSTLTWEEYDAGSEPIENPFVDVSESDYYYAAVLWAYSNNITSGKDATHFQPDAACTRAQVVTFLWRANGQPEPASTENPFVDVSKDSYYYKAVLWAAEKGITSGKNATHFQPDATVTRAQFVTFLWRAEGKPAPKGDNPFVDMANGQYYTDAVVWAYENGITSGKDATHFQPDANCIRAQVVTFLYRAKH